MPEEQGQIGGTQIAGEVISAEPTTQPQVGVYLNDATGSKMSYFLRYKVEMSSISCKDGQQELLGSFTIKSDTPSDVEALPETILGKYAFRDKFIRPRAATRRR